MKKKAEAPIKFCKDCCWWRERLDEAKVGYCTVKVPYIPTKLPHSVRFVSSRDWMPAFAGVDCPKFLEAYHEDPADEVVRPTDGCSASE